MKDWKKEFEEEFPKIMGRNKVKNFPRQGYLDIKAFIEKLEADTYERGRVNCSHMSDEAVMACACTPEIVRKEAYERAAKALTAELFHEIYERLAPSFGYETREDTKAFDPNSKNGKLMVATVNELAQSIRALKDE